MKEKTGWFVFNYNRLFCFGFTRRDAIDVCERITGEKWKNCRKYMRVSKCTISENQLIPSPKGSE